MKTALFLGHGSPMNVLHDNAYNRAFRQIGDSLPMPRAILCVSAHGYGNGTWVSSSPRPKLIYDFYGFPDALYQQQYPVSGCPELAEEVCRLLPHAQLDPDMGLDHGVWTVLKPMFPNADIPVVQLSLDASLSSTEHFAQAKLLRPLREQGVLIVGSGNIVHNLRAYSPDAPPHKWAQAFRQNINDALQQGEFDRIADYLNQWGDAARLSAPTPEHFLPLLYVLAQHDDGQAVELFNDEIVDGALSMTSVRVN